MHNCPFWGQITIINGNGKCWQQQSTCGLIAQVDRRFDGTAVTNRANSLNGSNFLPTQNSSMLLLLLVSWLAIIDSHICVFLLTNMRSHLNTKPKWQYDPQSIRTWPDSDLWYERSRSKTFCKYRKTHPHRRIRWHKSTSVSAALFWSLFK